MESYPDDTERLVARWEDRRAVKNLIGKYVMSLLLKREPLIVAQFWADAPDVSLGVNEGYYAGPEAVAAYYASVDRATRAKAQVLKAVFHEDLDDMSDEDLYGRGPLELRSLDNTVIEVAGDGRTAKGMFACFGLVTDLDETGVRSNWVFGWYNIDFIKQNGAWKLWHMLYLEDINEIAGEKWGVAHPPRKAEPGFEPLRGVGPIAPTVPCSLRAHYSGTRPFARLTRMPEPYETFAETFSYGAESGEALK